MLLLVLLQLQGSGQRRNDGCESGACGWVGHAVAASAVRRHAWCRVGALSAGASALVLSWCGCFGGCGCRGSIAVPRERLVSHTPHFVPSSLPSVRPHARSFVSSVLSSPSVRPSVHPSCLAALPLPSLCRFISKFFVVNHAHGQLLQGPVAHLPRDEFEVRCRHHFAHRVVWHQLYYNSGTGEV